MGTTKDDLVARMLIERDKLLLAVAGLQPEDAQRRAIGDWSVKDIVAHIAAWEAEAANRLEMITSGRESEIAYVEDDEVDEWNSRAVAERRTASWEEVLAELTEARERLLRAILALSEERFASPVGRVPVSVWLPNCTSEHDAEHSPDILKWRNREGV